MSLQVKAHAAQRPMHALPTGTAGSRVNMRGETGLARQPVQILFGTRRTVLHNATKVGLNGLLCLRCRACGSWEHIKQFPLIESRAIGNGLNLFCKSPINKDQVLCGDFEAAKVTDANTHDRVIQQINFAISSLRLRDGFFLLQRSIRHRTTGLSSRASSTIRAFQSPGYHRSSRWVGTRLEHDGATSAYRRVNRIYPRIERYTYRLQKRLWLRELAQLRLNRTCGRDCGAAKRSDRCISNSMFASVPAGKALKTGAGTAARSKCRNRESRK